MAALGWLLNLGFAGGTAEVEDPWIFTSPRGELYPRTPGPSTPEFVPGSPTDSDTLVPRTSQSQDTPLKRS